ncbi:hypothetical protein BDP81DRAFT_419491 [Colletotrichum phormii]|uniref:Uncharacterized protein n=1 Tax=Colletotrichum phormii TaxID=359342 RepID=A0AAI9ZXR5_9PEZI|nr:uncharacterized protein BDP81DRAFT_419491 [Colletotrichum phormii]KAK1640175.1 hypothetical protein BDP81DRAFT_419491 [Colletotrichum phormii]
MVDMDDATRLIGDLHQKLADLDHKVAAYRQDMALEFHRYSHQLLQNIPQHTKAEVDRQVAASFDNYPALRPALGQSLNTPLRDIGLPDSPPPPQSTQDTENLTEGHSNPGNPREPPPPSSTSTFTPPSVLPHAGTAALTSPDSVYDRERDRGFHGLFTPSYLPLLDSSHEAPTPASNQLPIPPPISNSAAIQDDMGRRKSSQTHEQPAIQVSVAATQTPERPNHERRATDDTTSSGASEQSESKVRRSALRRSSSGIKPPASPRRVRFEFEGGEVLPTASPQSSEPSLVQSHTLANSKSPPPSEDESMSVESLLGPDEDDSGPPPKKVSSSQALRALSRAPLDANTVWTVVNAEAQDKENGSMATSDSETSLQPSDSVGTLPKPQSPPKTTLVERKRAPEPLRPVSPERVSRRDDDEEDSDGSSSDDGFLAMAKPKSFANKKAILSPLSRSPTRTATAPYSPTRDKSGSHNDDKLVTQSDEPEDEDDEDMFHFEGLSAPPKPRARPAPIQEEEEEEEEEEETASNEPVTQTLYSTSPAVFIPKPVEPAIPAHLISGSVGSFRGRPVIMPVVKNPDVYQRAASLGDVSSFIGGLDGRSGVDDGDLSSYRASVGQALFSGTPRSLTERMMMEEAQSQRRAAAQRPQ